MLPMPTALGAAEQRLLRAFGKLPERDRATVIGLAELLLAPEAQVADDPVPAPGNTPRPDDESVVAAMRRLSGDYPMLQSSQLLHEASALMSKHLLQGQEATSVIDELQALFGRHYQALVAETEDRGVPS